GKLVTTKVDDGWIVGFDAGEFGAGLWWFSADGKRRYKISNDHVKCFVQTTEVGLLVVSGLSHGSTSRGRIKRLFRGAKGQWLIGGFLELLHAPEVVVRAADGSLVIATTHQLLRVVLASRKIEILVDQAFWGGLYPNSMVVTPSGKFFLG